MDIIQHFINNLEKLTGANWVQLIQANENDAFADKCDWSKLDGGDWSKLLKTHPQFKTNIPFEKLSDWDWGRLLPDFPEYAALCPADKRTDWADFIAAHPDHPALKDFDFSKIEEWEWDDLLKKQPKLLEKYPDFYDVCEQDILPHGWALRVAAFPERFADRCPWEKLNNTNWVQILSFQPQFADKCDFSKFDGRNWAALLSERPEFAEQCPFEIFDGNDWETLLGNHPGFADQCDWSKVMTHNWSMLLHLYPEWAEKYNCPFEQFSSWDWAELLDHCPRFAGKCDLTKLDGDELYLIFSNQPTLVQIDLLKNLTSRLGDFLEEYPEYQEYIGEKVPSWNDKLIENAEYVKDFILRITFRNGEVKQINIKPYIFRNPKVFQQMIDNSNIISQLQYDSGEVFWNDLMGINAHTLYNMKNITE